MLTSHVPSLEGDGQQLTCMRRKKRKRKKNERTIHVSNDASLHFPRERRRGVGVLTRERDVALVVASIAPLEHGERLTDRERPGGILERDDFLLVRGELGETGVLFELQVGPKVGRKRRKGEFDVCVRRIGDLEVHIAFELHRFDATLAQERDRDGFLDDDVYAAEI